MARRSIPIEEKIETQKEQVSKAKDKYEAELDKLEKLMRKRDELRSKELMEAFDFIDEHLYEFCMDNRMYSEYTYQSDPEGDESSADITLDEVGLCKGQKFALHYDFGDDWIFTITISKISEVQEDFKPRIVKSKGSIQQYPDWDEEDFDDE